MKTLVTGGAGFIGSHIAEALSGRGAEVIVLDNLSLGREENLSWPRAADQATFVRGDVGDTTLVRKLMAGCAWVFHQAALPSVPLSVSQPIETNRANLEATLNLLVAARDAEVARFVFASSSAIYGDSEVPSKHEALPPQPLSPYALQKYASERYCQLFHELYGLETVALRYFNVFGPRQSFDSPYSGVIARFCTAALEGQSPTIFGDGRQSRDFIYVENVVQANLLAAERPAERVAGRVFNVAGGASIDLLQLVEALNQLTRQRLQPRFEPPREGDVRHSEADIGAATRDLGYAVVTPFTRGLDKTLDFYRSGA
jgi:UDP-glucose 4-epimerase